MAKLSKLEAKRHLEACKILQQNDIDFDSAWDVYEHWQASAHHVNSVAGAFFTPIRLARDFDLEVSGRRIIDLCAGIGALSFMTYHSSRHEKRPEIVCIETNPDYVDAGRKLLPEATWIRADIFDLPSDLGRFDCAISNPPFGAVSRNGSGPRYTGRNFEFHAIDIAAELADYGVFIIPQNSAPFAYSGCGDYRERSSEAYARFSAQTGIILDPNCGIDCDVYRDDWQGVAPSIEIVCSSLRSVQHERQRAPVARQESAQLGLDI